MKLEEVEFVEVQEEILDIPHPSFVFNIFIQQGLYAPTSDKIRPYRMVS
jgi:hypothetical protein